MPWRSSTTATCTPVTTSSNRLTGSATSVETPLPDMCRRKSSAGSATANTTRCPGTAGVPGPLRLPRRVPAQPLHRTPDGEDGLNYLCAGYRAFFTHIDKPMKTMATFCSRAVTPTRSCGRGKRPSDASGRMARTGTCRRPPAPTGRPTARPPGRLRARRPIRALETSPPPASANGP